ncbi:DUF4112 domain-containing protein [Halogeometricum luteum]|uniref:DUF4112 domain-containing protein n=1 Tax=Halogeometricum luteum TaxID=2950537 RepID=A0ABU2FZV8_9EURY|nr:DUF4112 domain-containing protein [Halogeometricum sp. S3BR5-2]MDS0294065.1 DUF4112 domain-containing protein [Halogeometricum sp. S3BR5-2]
MSSSDAANADAAPFVVSGPVADAADPEAEALARLRRVSYYMDSAIPVPGTDWRIGLDPILGLLPVAGDLPAAAVSAYIVAEAAALGAPRETVARMVGNLVVDAVFGSIPLVGDAFDAAWKANRRNVRLFEARRADPSGAERDGRVLAVAGLLLFCLVVALGAGVALTSWWLLSQVV